MNRRMLILAGLGLLAGCATAGPPASVAPGAPLAELEPIYSAVAGKDALTIEVASNGCTTKADFAFYLERRGGEATLSFARRTLDRCRSFAMGKVALSFTWAELGVAPHSAVFLRNPLGAWTGPGAS